MSPGTPKPTRERGGVVVDTKRPEAGVASEKALSGRRERNPQAQDGVERKVRLSEG